MAARKDPPTREQYNAVLLQIAMEYMPSTYACKKCAWPVIKGYTCRTCGDDNPSMPPDSDATHPKD